MNLIQNAKSQPEAFIELYDLYGERVYQYLLRRLRQIEEAEDLTSVVWEKVLQKIHSLRAETHEGFCAWLFTIARNELNQYYKEEKKNTIDEIPETFADSAKGPDILSREKSEAELIQQFLTVLPHQQRETVELRYFADLKNKEIAPILGVSEKTVASNLSRALETLSAYLKKVQ